MREDDRQQSNEGPSDDKNQQNEEQKEDVDQIQELDPASTIDDGQLLNEDKNQMSEEEKADQEILVDAEKPVATLITTSEIQDDFKPPKSNTMVINQWTSWSAERFQLSKGKRIQ